MMDETDPGNYGWKVRMDHVFEETWCQNFRLRLRQIPDLLPMIVRYVIWWIVTWLIRGIKPFIDPFMQQGKQIYGVPLGGIGCGSIGRGFKGEFCRFQMTPGLYTYDVCHADQFIVSVREPNGSFAFYQKVLSGAGHPDTLSAWDWSFKPSDGHYKGLYPRAWYTFNIPEQNLVLECMQVSPVIPHNYKDSSMPMAAFVWKIQNGGSATKQISITFTFKNGTGSSSKGGKCVSQLFSVQPQKTKIHFEKIVGVSLAHKIHGIDTTYGVGCAEKANQTVTTMTAFDLQTGGDLWLKLSSTGHLDLNSTTDTSDEVKRGQDIGVAVCCSCVVQPKKIEEMVFSLVWHQPLIHFKGKLRQHKRRYAQFLNLENDSTNSRENTRKDVVQKLTLYCLQNYDIWDEAIINWQDPILRDSKLPDWFKSALFNELYYVADGGSVWFQHDPKLLSTDHTNDPEGHQDDIRGQVGRYAYLEGHEYRMYNTYDVHFYASFALALLWPKLQLSVQYDFADAIKFEDESKRVHLFDGHWSPRKQADTVAHDLGDPSEDPFGKINSYPLHDVSEWRDLNLKFILQVFRDYRLTQDTKFLNDMFPLCNVLMKKCLTWDKDGDGLIENCGKPDQTYDAWIMTGVSAYCGSLWLASLAAMTEMLQATDLVSMEPAVVQSDLNLYQDCLNRGKKSFHDKLWTGTYYKFDSSTAPHGKSIMSDQLCGHWWLSVCGVDSSKIFPKANVKMALQTIYENNVQKFGDGQMGAVNGMNPDGTIDVFALQSEEAWTGVTYALAATMIHQGMCQEGFKTAEGIYRTVYEKIGLGFETPEALYCTKKYRAIGYMRPLSIWSMKAAWDFCQQKNNT